MIEEIKKSYNPYKMWGSWVGVFLLVSLMIFLVLLHDNKIVGGLGKDIVEYKFCEGSPPIIGYIFCGMVVLGTFGFIIGYPLAIIIGFLIGWGIHSLIRKFKK